jgi:hypothetical protein
MGQSTYSTLDEFTIKGHVRHRGKQSYMHVYMYTGTVAINQSVSH